MAVVLLAAVTLGVFVQVAGFGFTEYDDDFYVTENQHVKAGLTWTSIRWAFTDLDTYWHPLTWLSLMLDASVGGVDPRIFHITNLALHLASTLLLFRFLVLTTGLVGRSCLVAMLFGIHPQHVESVAWVAERKDVLSTLCWMLVILAWRRYAIRPAAGRYAVVAVLLAAGLMAKPMLVTLPLVLLLLDLWPLGRFGRSGSVAPSRVPSADSGVARTPPPAARIAPPRPILWLLAEKIPLLGLSVASAIVTLIAQHRGGALGTLESYPLGVRAANAVVSAVAYIARSFWPANLAVFYPHPGSALSMWVVLDSALALAAATLLAVLALRSRPWLTVGWLWYLLTLAPVIGLVQVGQQARADRYTYVPHIGLFVLLVWGGAEIVERAARVRTVGGDRYARQTATSEFRRRARFAGTVASALACGSLAIAAHRQAGYWRDGPTLFRRAIDVTGPNALAQNNLGYALLIRGDLDGALLHCKEAVRIHPEYPEALNNVGQILARKGRRDEARALYERALRLDPGNARLMANLGLLYFQVHALEEAAAQYRQAIAADPRFVEAHNDLGIILEMQGKPLEATAQFSEALRLRPGDAVVLRNLERTRRSLTGRSR